jgi:autotransporter-associated beta strand protein
MTISASAPISLRGSAGTTDRYGILNSQVTSTSTVTAELGGIWTINSTGNVWTTTQINTEGHFKLGATDALATGAQINLSGGANGYVDLNGFDQTAAGLNGTPTTGSATIANHSTTSDSILTLAGLLADKSFGFAITDGTGGRTTSLVMNNGNAFVQRLTGASTYTGVTIVSNGTLIVNGSLGSAASGVTVDGGTLAGTGAIARAVTVNSGATLRPGDPIGVLSITGDVTVNGGATNLFALGVDSASSASVAVNGNLTVAGVIDVSDLGGFTNGTYTLFTYTGALDTNGISVNNPLPGGQIGTIDTTSNPGQVDLVVTPGGGPAPTASFTATALSGVAPLQVTFTDTSTDSPTSWFWDFNNDSTVDAMAQNPTNTFGAGTWTVSLVASNANGASSAYTTNINVITVQQSWEAFYGVLANGTDFDGDGVSNGEEFRAGFNPTNGAAHPRILGLTRTGNDLTITYRASNGDTNYAGGAASRTNVVDYSAGAANGGYNGSFAGLFTNVLSGGNGSGVITNAVEIGGGTNVPARYFRARVLAP